MQILWSRTAQARSCRCATCLSAATSAVARRTTTAAGRRRLNAGDALAALSSAMFATAALADAKLKEDRTRQWDQAIEDVKAGRSTTTPDGQSVSNLSTGLQDASLDVTKSIPLPIRKLYGSAASSKPREIERIQPPSGLPLDPENAPFWMQLKTLSDHLKQSIRDEARSGHQEPDESAPVVSAETALPEYETRISPREPRRRVHLDKMQSMIAKLVFKLLLGVEQFRPKTISIPQGEDSECKHPVATSQMFIFQSGSTTLPSYVWNPKSGDHIWAARRRLNKTILSIFKSAKTSDRKTVDSMVLKICYSLLVSTSPPDIRTYYLMIRSFTEMNQHDLASVVVESLLQDSLFRPDEPTVAAILSHYRATGNQSAFNKLVQQMRGVEFGFKFGRRHVKQLADDHVIEWALNSKVIHRGAFIVEKFPRDAQVFRSLILGAENLLDMKSAIRFLKAAFCEGVTVPVDVLSPFLQRIICTDNYKLIVSVLSALSQQWRDAFKPQIQLRYTKQVREQIYGLLRYVTRSGTLHPSLDPVLFNRLLRHLHFEELRDSISEYVEQVQSLHTKIAAAMSKSPEVPKQRLQSLRENIQALEEDLTAFMHYRCTLKKHTDRYKTVLKSESSGKDAGLAEKLSELLTSVHLSFADDEFWEKDLRFHLHKLRKVPNNPSVTYTLPETSKSMRLSKIEENAVVRSGRKHEENAVVVPDALPPLLPPPSFGLFLQPLLRHHEPTFASMEHQELEYRELSAMSA